MIRLKKAIEPIVKWWGGLHLPFTHKKLTGVHYFMYRDMIKVGTTFATATYGEFSNLINPSELPHGAVYIGKVKGIPSVLEAIGKGVVLTDLVTFLTTKDRVIAFEPGFEFDKENFASHASKIEGLEYDYIFTSDNKKFYCFEAVVQMFIMAGATKEWIVERKFNESYFTSDTFTKDASFHKLFEVK